MNNFVLVLIPKLLNGIVTFGLNIYAFRNLDVAEYGVASFCLNSFQVFDGVMGSAFDFTVIGSLQTTGQRVPASFSALEYRAIVAKLALGLMLCLFFLLFGEPFGNAIFHRQGDRGTLVLLGLAATGVLLLRSVQVAFQVRTRFLPFAATDLIHTSCRVGLVGAGFFLGKGSAGWIVGSFFAAATVTSLIFLPFLFRPGGARVDAVGIPGWRVLWDRTRTTFATSALGASLNRLDLLVLGYIASASELGLYGAALSLAIVPEILATYTAPTLLPRLLPLWREGRLRRVFLWIHGIYFGFAALAIILLWLCPDGLFLLIFPERYVQSIAVLRFLFPGMLASASLLPLTLNFLMLVKPTVFFKFDLYTVPLQIGLYIAGAHMHGAIGMALALTGFRVGKMIFIQLKAWQLIRSGHLPIDVLP